MEWEEAGPSGAPAAGATHFALQVAPLESTYCVRSMDNECH